MNPHYRTSVWRLSAILALVLTVPVLAEEPKPKPAKPPKAAAEKQPAKEAPPEDPAVAAILETKPATPAECIRAAKILADLGRADLAKGFLKKALDANLDPKQLADLAEQLGAKTFLDMAGQAALQPEAKRLADAVTAALSAKLQDPERIAGLIRQLQDPSEDKRFRAMAGLQEAGSATIGPLLAVLADPARAAEAANVRAVLAEMGRTARGPLAAVVEGAGPKLAVEAIRVLGAMKDQSAAYCLLRPRFAERSDAAVRATAELEIQRLTGSLPTRAKAVRLLSDAARAYSDRRQPVEGVVDGKVALWRWDESRRQCVPRNVTPAEAARTLAAGWASDAYAIAPDDPQVRLLYLATLFEAAAYRKGLDRPWDEKNPALAEAKQFGAATLEAELEYAMAQGHPVAAAAAARLLGEIGTAGELLGQNSVVNDSRGLTAPGEKTYNLDTVRGLLAPGYGGLIAAVQSPDRRLRMAAAEAIVRLQPARPFAGSSYMLDALGFFAASHGVRGALVACPNLEEARNLAGRLAAAGYQVRTCRSGKELLSQAARSPDYELALIDVTVDRPTAGTLLQQLRHDPRTASLRVGLIARAGYFELAGHLAQSDPLARAFARPQDDQAFRWQLDQLASIDPQEFVGFELRQRQAARALDLLAELSRSSDKLYDLRRVQDSVIAALGDPRIAAKAVGVLANLNSAEAQRALADLAGRLTQPLALRQAAAAAFRQNVQDHGVLLTTEEIHQQYQRYNQSEKQDRATQHVLGLILDCLEASAPVKK